MILPLHQRSDTISHAAKAAINSDFIEAKRKLKLRLKEPQSLRIFYGVT